MPMRSTPPRGSPCAAAGASSGSPVTLRTKAYAAGADMPSSAA